MKRLWGWSRTKTDNGGRLREVETFSSATLSAPWGSNVASTGKVLSNYDANTNTLTDEASKQRRSIIDGLGRLTKVEDMQPLPSTTVYAMTTYIYDVRDNLTRVNQGSQMPRTFVYDWLKRLINVCHPESGNLSYTYDANANCNTFAKNFYGNFRYHILWSMR